MSRSYKHTPYNGEAKDKFFKKYFNRKLRRKKLKHNLQHGLYKKYSSSWEICDYYTIQTKNFEQYYKHCIDKWHKWNKYHKLPYPDKNECWKEYQKWYIRK